MSEETMTIAEQLEAARLSLSYVRLYYTNRLGQRSIMDFCPFSPAVQNDHTANTLVFGACRCVWHEDPRHKEHEYATIQPGLVEKYEPSSERYALPAGGLLVWDPRPANVEGVWRAWQGKAVPASLYHPGTVTLLLEQGWHLVN